MGKLHQLLAVEADLDSAQKTILEETRVIFEKKQQLFYGMHKHLEVFDEDDKTKYPEEHLELTTTVPERLAYQQIFITDYFDAILQKETTNQQAKAAITIDGHPITDELPATFLLAMEKKLLAVREIYKKIPTLPQGVRWVPDDDAGGDRYRAQDPEEKFKTKKVFNHQVLVEPTEHHPAQIERWEEQINVGKYIIEKWCGMITSADKANLLSRTDTLIRAVKKARQKANNIDANKATVGQLLFDYIHND